jgi:adenosylmethionine-8-amino-7-oxononanoate aminotransferase
MDEAGELSRHLFLDFTPMRSFSQEPLVFTRGEGVRLFDAEGKAYWDGLSGIFVVNAGHGNTRIIEAVQRQAAQLSFHPPLGGTSEPALELGRLLTQIAPPNLTGVKFLNSGSEATETAVKLARQYYRLIGKPEKRKVISRYRSWHGSTLAALSASGTSESKTPFEPLMPDFLHVLPPYCYRCPFDASYPGCALTCARVLERTIVAEGPETVAVVMVDPIMVTAGVLVPPAEYYGILRAACDRYDVQLVFDEVITGFGRTGHLFACDLYGIQPDMLCLAKGITSGYGTLSATMASEKIVAAFWERDEAFKHGHTLGGNPLAAAAAVANVREIVESRLWENGAATGQHLKRRMQELYRHPIVGDVRGEGLLIGVEFVRDRETRESFPAAVDVGGRVKAEGRRRGLLLRASPGFIAIGPPLITTVAEADAMVEILDETIGAVCAGLPA